jgi:hypothetical protein
MDQPPVMDPPVKDRQPPRKRRVTANRVRLGFEAVLAVISVFLALAKNDEAKQSQEQEQNLSIEITNLVEEVDDGNAEIEALQGQIDELEASDPPSGDPAAEDASGFLALETAVDSSACDGYNYGNWAEQAVQYAGDPYSRGFNCGMYKGNSTDTGGGYVDFLVPEGAVTLSGLAGIDERSDATDMQVAVAVYSVPNVTDPVWSAELAYGGLEAFELDVSAVSRVRFEVTMLDAEEGKQFTAGFADVRFMT